MANSKITSYFAPLSTMQYTLPATQNSDAAITYYIQRIAFLKIDSGSDAELSPESVQANPELASFLPLSKQDYIDCKTMFANVRGALILNMNVTNDMSDESIAPDACKNTCEHYYLSQYLELGVLNVTQDQSCITVDFQPGFYPQINAHANPTEVLWTTGVDCKPFSTTEQYLSFICVLSSSGPYPPQKKLNIPCGPLRKTLLGVIVKHLRKDEFQSFELKMDGKPTCLMPVSTPKLICSDIHESDNWVYTYVPMSMIPLLSPTDFFQYYMCGWNNIGINVSKVNRMVAMVNGTVSDNIIYVSM